MGKCLFKKLLLAGSCLILSSVLFSDGFHGGGVNPNKPAVFTSSFTVTGPICFPNAGPHAGLVWVTDDNGYGRWDVVSSSATDIRLSNNYWLGTNDFPRGISVSTITFPGGVVISSSSLGSPALDKVTIDKNSSNQLYAKGLAGGSVFAMSCAPLMVGTTAYDMNFNTQLHNTIYVLEDKNNHNIVEITTMTAPYAVITATGGVNLGVVCVQVAGMLNLTVYFNNGDFIDGTNPHPGINDDQYFDTWLNNLAGHPGVITQYYTTSVWTAQGFSNNYVWANPDSMDVVSGYTDPPTFNKAIGLAVRVVPPGEYSLSGGDVEFPLGHVVLDNDLHFIRQGRGDLGIIGLAGDDLQIDSHEGTTRFISNNNHATINLQPVVLPSYGQAGDMVFNSNDSNKPYYCDGSNWQPMGGSNGASLTSVEGAGHFTLFDDGMDSHYPFPGCPHPSEMVVWDYGDLYWEPADTNPTGTIHFWTGVDLSSGLISNLRMRNNSIIGVSGIQMSTTSCTLNMNNNNIINVSSITTSALHIPTNAVPGSQWMCADSSGTGYWGVAVSTAVDFRLWDNQWSGINTFNGWTVFTAGISINNSVYMNSYPINNVSSVMFGYPPNCGISLSAGFQEVDLNGDLNANGHKVSASNLQVNISSAVHYYGDISHCTGIPTSSTTAVASYSLIDSSGDAVTLSSVDYGYAIGIFTNSNKSLKFKSGLIIDSTTTAPFNISYDPSGSMPYSWIYADYTSQCFNVSEPGGACRIAIGQGAVSCYDDFIIQTLTTSRGMISVNSSVKNISLDSLGLTEDYNSFANGGFETGDLPPWTTDPDWQHAAVTQGGGHSSTYCCNDSWYDHGPGSGNFHGTYITQTLDEAIYVSTSSYFWYFINTSPGAWDHVNATYTYDDFTVDVSTYYNPVPGGSWAQGYFYNVNPRKKVKQIRIDTVGFYPQSAMVDDVTVIQSYSDVNISANNAMSAIEFTSPVTFFSTTYLDNTSSSPAVSVADPTLPCPNLNSQYVGSVAFRKGSSGIPQDGVEGDHFYDLLAHKEYIRTDQGWHEVLFAQ